MKIHYNAETGVLKVRPSIRTILAVGVTLAGIKMVYDFSESMYIVALRRTTPKLDSWIQGKKEQQS